MKRVLAGIWVALSAVTPAVLGDAVIFTETGTDAEVTATLNKFRNELGPLNANVRGSFGSGRREINWDGVPDRSSAPVGLPFNFFNSNGAGRARGVVYSTPDDAFFMVSADSDNPTGTLTNFANLEPQYGGLFRPFSSERLFTPVASTKTVIDFFVAGTNIPATISGFGAIFLDVDLPDSTKISFFSSNGRPLTTVFAPVATVPNGGASFVGVLFDAGERLARVEIVSGNIPIGPGNREGPTGDGGFADAVVMDDFVYGEPVPGDIISRCDMNCDGSVNQFDIQSFVALLTRAAPPCSASAGDTNVDGSVNQFDIQGFANCLAAP